MIVDTGGDTKISFAKLEFMFKCNIFGIVHDIALVRYYNLSHERIIASGEKLTGFQCVTLSSERDAEFLFLGSVIRGAYVAQVSEIRRNEYFVIDTIDADMYLRLRNR